MEINHINTHCPKLGERVVVTVTRSDLTPQLINPPFRFIDCDSVLECGIVKEEGITPDWSVCPLHELRFLK
jgi:hypothetical protein